MAKNISEPIFDFTHYYRLSDLDVISFRLLVERLFSFMYDSSVHTISFSFSKDELNTLYQLHKQLRYGTQYRNKNSSRIDNDEKRR